MLRAEYAMQGEKDSAFESLNKAFVSRAGVVDIYVDPRLDNLRSDPLHPLAAADRVSAIIASKGIPGEPSKSEILC
jgi:hypothetical protein